MLAAKPLVAVGTATALFAVMPGPAAPYTVARTVARGRRSGLFGAFGSHVGGSVHVRAAGTLRARVVRSASAARLARRLGGSALIGLGAHLAAQRG